VGTRELVRKPGDDTSEEATQTWNRAGPWEPRIREECEAVRDHVGVLDLPGFSRFDVEGPGATRVADGQDRGWLPKPGRMNLAYFPDARGRILTEMSVMNHGPDHYMLITAATAQWHDRDILLRDKPEGITLTDRTRDFSTLIVTGPASRDLFTAIGTEADLSLPWLSVQTGTVAGLPCGLARVSFAGELGWEIHAETAHIPALYDAVLRAGAKPFGMWALNSLRIEKGYRAWKGDLSTDYSLLEGGLDRFIRLRQAPGLPRQGRASGRETARGEETLRDAAGRRGRGDAPYMSTLWHDGAVVGETTSGAWGYRVGGSIALGMLRTDLAVAATELEVDIFGDRRPAIVQPDGSPVGPRQRPAEGLTHGRPSPHARAVIIGGGVSGCSVAYHLAKLGWTDIVLLERKQLTCGTTWHAAGLMGQLRGTQNMTRLAKYSADLYVKLEEETGVATGMRQVGSISLGADRGPARGTLAAGHARPRLRRGGGRDHTPPRSRRCIPMWRSATSPAPCTCPATASAIPPTSPWRWPRAHGCGAQIVEGVKVTPSPMTASASRASTGSGRRDRAYRRRHRHQLRRHVGPRSGRAIGRHPAAACLRAFLSCDGTHRGPRPPAGPAGSRRMRLLQVRRRQDDAGRLRAARQALGHVRHPRGFRVRRPARGFRAFRADPRHGHRRMPMFETAGIHTFFNGPESFTPDDRYYLGEAPELRGYWVAAGYNSIGIVSSGGAGMALAQWIVDGEAALRPVGGRHPPRAAVPAQPPLPEGTRDGDARPALRRSLALPAGGDRARRAAEPVHEHLKGAGAVFGEVAGWERANWFADPGQAREYRYGWNRQNWFENPAPSTWPCAGGGPVRHDLLRQDPGGGARCLAFPQAVCANEMDVRAGRIVYTQMLNAKWRHRKRPDRDAAVGDRVPAGRARRDAAARSCWLRAHLGDASSRSPT
jgi:glycine cleavage system aminomethyltransferase T/glycine/D-amino acid oxidase-like deaminating enzyme